MTTGEALREQLIRDNGLDAARVDPDYVYQDHAVSEINALARMMFTDWITTQVGDGNPPGLDRQ